MRARQVGSGLLGATNTERNRVQQCLFVALSVNFQLTTDQTLFKIHTGTQYLITTLAAVCRTGGATVACTGGVYTAAAKGGTAIVSAAQSWLGMTAADVGVIATVAVPVSSATPLILSLTSGSTAAVTADVYVYGIVLT